LLDINTQGMAATKDLIAKVNPEIDVLSINVDIADEVGVVKAIAETVETFGEINIAVNNAGAAGPIASSAEVSVESYRRVLEVNVIGMWIVQKEIIKQMLQQKPRSKG
jgi:NAD(P)-dependent dehydrogenase (short-subunit alcohol dehydrogenase family)